MNYNTNILYNNYTSKNPSKRGYQTEPYQFYQSPQTQRRSNKTMNSNQNPNIQNKNINISNGSNYNQTLLSPNTKNSLKWRNIMKINLHQLKNTRDISIIQPNLDNLVFGEVTEDDIQSLPEMNIVRLVEILQTSCDILLNEQQELEGEMMKLENDNIQVINKFKSDEKKYVKNKDLICRLKKEKKRDLSVLYSYQNVINNLRNGTYNNIRNITKNITDINIKKKNIDDVNVNSNREKEFKCQICPNKSFMTEFELHKHLSEVHEMNKSNNNNQNRMNQIQNQLPPKINIQLPPNYYNNENNNNNNDNNEELIQKMDDMKRQFQETLTKFQEDKKREQEESKINMMRNNNNQEIIDRFENNFKDTLNDFKLMMENNNKNKNEPNIIIEDNGNNDDDYYNIKNREISRLNEELRNIKNELNIQKRNYETKKIQLENNISNLRGIVNKKYKEDEGNNISHSNINISINRQIQYQMEAIKNKENKPKTTFNSGKIVSDHDDTDEELKNKKRILELYNNDRDIINKLINKKTVISKVPEINNTINQNNFFIKNTNEKENIPEVSVILEDSKNEKSINLRKGELIKKNIPLDNYYKRYIRRDKKYLLEPEFSNYFIDTLPKDFDLDPSINDAANNIAMEKVGQVGVDLCPKNMGLFPEVEEERLKEENIDNLNLLVNSLINNMDKKNTDKKGKVNDYYLSVREVIGLDNLIKTAHDIINKPKKDLHVKFNIKEEKKEAINEDKDKEKDKQDLLEKKKTLFSNENNKIDNNKKDGEIKNGVIISEIKDNNIEEIVLGSNDDNNNDKKNNEKKDNNNENNTKLRNKPNDNINNTNNNKKENYIENINTDITGLNKNQQNKVIVETTDIKINDNNANDKNNKDNKDNKDNNALNNQNNDQHLDAPYNSEQANPSNDRHLDAPYNSEQANQKKDDTHLDAPYNSEQANQKKDDTHLDAPYGSHQTNQNKDDTHLDAPFTSTQSKVPNNSEKQKEESTDKNLDAPFTSTQSKAPNNTEKQKEENTEKHLDAPYNSGQAISGNNTVPNQTGDVSYSSKQIENPQGNK